MVRGAGMKTTIDSQQLRVFVAIAETLSLSRAAAELDLTPSGISHCLKALEGDLGCRLVERTSRRVSLTVAGQQFREEAEHILAQMKDARGRLRSQAARDEGELRIGLPTGIAPLLLPSVLREFRESFPAYRLAVRPPQASPRAEDFRSEEFHLVIAIEPIPGPGLECAPLGEDALVFCTHPMHPWAIKRQVPHEEIVNHPLILPPHGTPCFQRLSAYFRVENIRLQPFLELSDERDALELVRRDLGVAILPSWLVRADRDAGRVVTLPLGRRRLRRRWGVVHARTPAWGLAEELFVSLCRRVFQDLTHDPDL